MKWSNALFVLCLIGSPALAKLSPPTPEQSAAAEASKAKAAETSKKDAELLAKYQDRAVENYKHNKQNAISTAPASKKP